MSNNNWYIEEINGVKLIRFTHLSKYSELLHFVTTRVGVVSKGVLSSMNIGFTKEDNPEDVLENRKLLAAALQIPFDSFVFERQTHSDNITVVDLSHKKRGLFSKFDSLQNNDGFIVQEPGVCPVAMHADCTPVILYDPVQKVAAAIHAGWRGTLKLIAQKGVEKMCSEFGTNPVDVLAGIGPSIGPCCYEVGEDVVSEVKKVFKENADDLLLYKGKPKFHFDLWEANRLQLLNAGLKKDNIVICDLCSYDHPELLFSSRYNHSVTGRMGAGVMIRK